jgi:hypothetical protein
MRGTSTLLALSVALGLAGCVTVPAGAPVGDAAAAAPTTGRVVWILERPGDGATQPTTYEVRLRLQDGRTQTLQFMGMLPFSLGQEVAVGGGDVAALAAPSGGPPAAGATTTGPAATPGGQWVYTQPYGWVWAPAAGVYTYAPGYAGLSPYTSVYLTGRGWLWVDAPWLWRWAPNVYVGSSFGYRPGWGGWGRPRGVKVGGRGHRGGGGHPGGRGGRGRR